MESHKLTNILLVLVFIALAYLTFTHRDISVDMSTGERDRTISVTGEAETFVAPDTASVSFSVTKKAQTTENAMNSINERMNVLLAQLKGFDVKEKDIKTVNYSVQPQYSYNNNKQIFEGYRATQRIQVKIRDLEKTSDILSTVNSAGVDNVSQLTFFVDNEEEVKEKLRKEAIKNAKEKAKVLAQDLGVNLNEIVGYSNGNFNDGFEPAYRSQDFAYSMNAKEEVAEAVVPTGENQFKVIVTVMYKIN